VKLKVGIVGCGTIGGLIAKACVGRLNKKIELVALCDIDDKKINALNKKLKLELPKSGMDSLIKKSSLVIEAASGKISGQVLEKCIKHKKSCIIMSVGGLIGKESILKKAESQNVRVFVPSGALCGLDGVKSASVGKIYAAKLTTRKNPKALKGAPYIVHKKIDLNSIKGEKVIFKGNVIAAIKGFPQNVNVAASLSLAGIGPQKTEVNVVVSPRYTKNIHEVELEGEFGKLFTRTENVPSLDNPKTSRLAAFSAIATLKSVVSSLKVGT